MRVAIVGAGLSGLSCAFELEKHKIEPVIYEVQSYIGDSCMYASFTYNKKYSNAPDILEFAANAGMELKPLSTVSSMVWHACDKTAIIKGRLGYLFNNSQDNDSLKKQIFCQLKISKVNYNRFGDYRDLSKKYDYVVVSTGNHGFADELGCWHEKSSTCVRGALVLGEFDPNTITVWENAGYLRNGYAILTPLTNKKASILLSIAEINSKEMDYYWELFLFANNIKYAIVEEFETEYRIGHVYPLTFENIIFTGNSAGGMLPLFGSGLMKAVLSGICAARFIAKGESYEEQISELNSKIKQPLNSQGILAAIANKEE